MASFYLVLPSNEIGNTLSKFTVRLPDRISLEGDWEVGLVEIAYQNTWFNINKQTDGDLYILNFGEGQQMVKGTIPINNYESIEQLIFLIKDTIQEMRVTHRWEKSIPITLRYNPVNGRVQIKTYRPYVYLYLSERVAYMLGFDHILVTKVYKAEGSNRISIAEHPPDLKAGFYAMYIYCDLVAPQIVGDKFAPLIRTITVSGKYGDSIEREYINPHYVPVLKKDFESVEINIKDDLGVFVPFNFGKTIVKLHFRKRRQ